MHTTIPENKKPVDVVAVEPVPRMQDVAKTLHPDSRIRWLDDQLPSLGNVFRAGLTLDLIWLSAAWMHVPPGFRQRALMVALHIDIQVRLPPNNTASRLPIASLRLFLSILSRFSNFQRTEGSCSI